MVLLLLFALTPRTWPQTFREFFSLSDSRVPAKARMAASCDVGGWRCVERGVVWGASGQPPRHFFGQRYLPDDRVAGIFVESPTRVWIKTAGGFSRIESRQMTLGQKAAYFERRIQAHHDHEGFIRGSDKGGLPPHDNDGLWTAIYIGAECFRFAVTHSPEARVRARRSMEAVMRLEEVTGIPGFPARAMIRKGEYRHNDGVWRPSPDGVHEWKSDTSSDELAGHFFAYSLYYDLVAVEAEKPRIRAVVSRIMRHLMEHNYTLTDWTGRPTTWAQYSAGYLKDHAQERSLNPMLLLSHLLVTHHITGDPAFLAEYDKLIAAGYHLDMARYIETRDERNYSDEEMAMLGYYHLLLYEKRRELRQVYLAGFEQWWQEERGERNPWWIATHAALLGGGENREEGARTLGEIPMDLREWRVENSWRKDITWRKDVERAGHRQAVELLRPDERPVMKWNSNPFVVDGGGDGSSEDDGAFYLLPYWMGRYLHLWQ